MDNEFLTPAQKNMMKIYDRIFEPINRAIKWIHARWNSNTIIFAAFAIVILLLTSTRILLLAVTTTQVLL